MSAEVVPSAVTQNRSYDHDSRNEPTQDSYHPPSSYTPFWTNQTSAEHAEAAPVDIVACVAVCHAVSATQLVRKLMAKVWYKYFQLPPLRVEKGKAKAWMTASTLDS